MELAAGPDKHVVGLVRALDGPQVCEGSQWEGAVMKEMISYTTLLAETIMEKNNQTHTHKDTKFTPTGTHAHAPWMLRMRGKPTISRRYSAMKGTSRGPRRVCVPSLSSFSSQCSSDITACVCGGEKRV